MTNNKIQEKIISSTAKTININKKRIKLDTGPGDIQEWDSLGNQRILNKLEIDFKVKFGIDEIIEMEKLYFSKQLKNILLLVNKDLSFDKNLNGDFDFQNNLIIKNDNKKFIYTGCQIINKKLLSGYKDKNFSITNVWNDLVEKKELYGFETNNEFYHLTDLQTFKKLQDL